MNRTLMLGVAQLSLDRLTADGFRMIACADPAAPGSARSNCLDFPIQLFYFLGKSTDVLYQIQVAGRKMWGGSGRTFLVS